MILLSFLEENLSYMYDTETRDENSDLYKKLRNRDQTEIRLIYIFWISTSLYVFLKFLLFMYFPGDFPGDAPSAGILADTISQAVSYQNLFKGSGLKDLLVNPDDINFSAFDKIDLSKIDFSNAASVDVVDVEKKFDKPALIEKFKEYLIKQDAYDLSQEELHKKSQTFINELVKEMLADTEKNYDKLTEKYSNITLQDSQKEVNQYLSQLNSEDAQEYHRIISKINPKDTEVFSRMERLEYVTQAEVHEAQVNIASTLSESDYKKFVEISQRHAFRQTEYLKYANLRYRKANNLQ
jgi:hypothetical protein